MTDAKAPYLRVRGWCRCKGIRGDVYGALPLLDITERQPRAAYWAGAFITAHGAHPGFRLDTR